MAIRVVKGWIQNWKYFCLKINILKGNYRILKIGVMGRCRKLAIILENEVIKILILSKNVNNKKCAPQLKFFNEKKIRKILMIFDIDN